MDGRGIGILKRAAFFLTVLLLLLTGRQQVAPREVAGIASGVALATEEGHGATPEAAPPLTVEEDPPVPTPEPTQTWAEVWEQQGIDVTAEKTVRRCARYIPLIDRWNPDFNLPVDLVLAVMAQESACLVDNDDGVSVGLMAVTPAGWTTTRDRLMDPAINIFWGMKILWLTLQDEKHNPEHDIRTALAAYNCGWVSLEAGKCFSFGGFAYADRVLDFWRPRFSAYARP